MKWKIIDTGKNLPDQNMSLDYSLLRNLQHEEEPILHLYEWEGKCATYGHFLDPYKYLKREAVEESGLTLARRPTGGGIVFHLNDFAFSILIPACRPAYSLNTQDNYAFIHGLIANILGDFFKQNTRFSLLKEETAAASRDAPYFCMAKPTHNDVMCRGRKAAGGAQRLTKYGFLHQGTISFAFPEKQFLSNLFQDRRLIEEMLRNSFIVEEDCNRLYSDFKKFFIGRFK